MQYLCYRLFFIVLLFLAWKAPLTAQEAAPTTAYGARGGLVVALGRPVTRVGLLINTYFYSGRLQWNTEWRLHRNFRQYGPPGGGWEVQLSSGLLLGLGESSLPERRPFWGPALGNFSYRHALAYAVHYYGDQIGTSQFGGSLAWQAGRFQLQLENDLLAPGSHFDRYRTGAFRFSWRERDLLAELRAVLWTGDPKDGRAKTVRQTDYPCRWGYKDLSACRYGRYSHGVLAVQAQYYLGKGQVAQAGLGLDAEPIRNFFQNRLIHDLWFVPAGWNKARNPHFPMLDIDGNPFLFQADQELRPALAYWHLALNDGGSY